MNSDNHNPATRPNISLKEIELVPLTFDDSANFEEQYIGYLKNTHEFCKIFFLTIQFTFILNKKKTNKIPKAVFIISGKFVFRDKFCSNDSLVVAFWTRGQFLL